MNVIAQMNIIKCYLNIEVHKQIVELSSYSISAGVKIYFLYRAERDLKLASQITADQNHASETIK